MKQRSRKSLADTKTCFNNHQRTVQDVEASVAELDLPLHLHLAAHVRQPANRSQTLRLLRHLLVEQILTAPSIHPLTAVYAWIVSDWSYRPAHDLYRGFLGEFELAGRICPARLESVQARLEEFRLGTVGVLRGKTGLVLVEERADLVDRSAGALHKRRRSSLPSIPEEDALLAALKRSRSQDALPDLAETQ